MSKHLLSISDLSNNQLNNLLDRAQYWSELGANSSLFHDYFLAPLFFETSTRTRCSFEIAAKKLGANVIDFDCQSSSLNKGESDFDTIATLAAMGVQGIIVRHRDDNYCQNLAKQLEAIPSSLSIINAGTGVSDHPTQALLDMLTIRQHKPNFSQLKIAIVGDVKHSRVARSDFQAFKLLGFNEIRVIAPTSFMAEDWEKSGVTIFDNLEKGLENVDVIMMLRIQKERLVNTDFPDPEGYFQSFALTPKNLAFAKPDAIVMHPGPTNRGIEIDSVVADGPQSVILQQVRNGVYVRMAVLEWLLT